MFPEVGGWLRAWKSTFSLRLKVCQNNKDFQSSVHHYLPLSIAETTSDQNSCNERNQRAS